MTSVSIAAIARVSFEFVARAKTEESPPVEMVMRGPDSLERLEHEASILSRLASCEGLPRVVAVLREARSIVFEDVDGVSLARVLKSGPLELPTLLDVALAGARTRVSRVW